LDRAGVERLASVARNLEGDDVKFFGGALVFVREGTSEAVFAVKFDGAATTNFFAVDSVATGTFVAFFVAVAATVADGVEAFALDDVEDFCAELRVLE